MMLCWRGEVSFCGLGSLSDGVRVREQNKKGCSENDAAFKPDFHSNCV